jgi:prepilin-type N-terminal cleavage/methylation domain-containing protein
MATNSRPKISHSNLGFSLVETMVALVIFGAMVGTMLPMFGAYKVKTINNDIRLGASAVTQRVMDDLRRANVRNLPNAGTVEALPSAPDGTGESTHAMSYKGKVYRVAITYCSPNTDCDADSRRVAVKAYFGDGTDPIFQLETVYTELRN